MEITSIATKSGIALASGSGLPS